MPMAGLVGSDLCRVSGFKPVADPYTGQEWAAIPAIRPDWAIIHVHEADRHGNGRIKGARYDDVLLAKASRDVILTCERLVDPIETRPEDTDIPGFMVRAVVEAPGGAWPASCHKLYGIDEAFLADYVRAAAGPATFPDFVEERILSRHPGEQLPGAKGGAGG